MTENDSKLNSKQKNDRENIPDQESPNPKFD